MPERVQRKRIRGWRMPPNTVYVGRPTRWGNPWKPGKDGTATHCVREYRLFTERPARIATGWHNEVQIELGGRNLACWCALDKPCHADVLLELANPSRAVDVVGISGDTP